MTEAKLSTAIQKFLPGVHWQRIENLVGVGCPDLNGCVNGKEFWLELKIIGQAPTRPAQKVWHLRGRKAGRKAYRFSYYAKEKIASVDQMGLDGFFENVDRFRFNQANLSVWVASI